MIRVRENAVQLTREWIHRGVSAGALPPASCQGGPFECPFAAEQGGSESMLECELLARKLDATSQPPCRPGDWLIEAARITVIH